MQRLDDLGDSGDGGIDPHCVTRFDSGDQSAQAVLVGAGEPDIAAESLGFGKLFVQVRIGLDDLGLGDREHPAAGLASDDTRDRGIHDAHPIGG